MKYTSKGHTSGEKALTKKEYEKLLSVIDTIEDELFLKMAITTGLRREDLANVKISNLNLNEKLLIFHESKKGNDRQIPIPDEIALLISKYLKTIEKRDLLFSCSGTQIYRRFNGYRDKTKRYRPGYFEKAGIANRPIHAFRATAIKFMKDAGFSDPQIMAITGDTLEVIQQHYMTPSIDELRDVVQKKAIL